MITMCIYIIGLVMLMVSITSTAFQITTTSLSTSNRMQQFCTLSIQNRQRLHFLGPTGPTTTAETSTTVLFAEQKKKRKRRRKARPATPEKDPVKVSQETIEGIDNKDNENDDDDTVTAEELATINEVARFEFQKDKDYTMSVVDATTKTPSSSSSSTTTTTIDDDIVTTTSTPAKDVVETSSNAIPLPDIKEARKKKQMEEELAKLEQDKEEKRKKIKRSDKEAFTKLLEQQPFADADDSFFEEEEYGVVSALLGERTKSFLSIPFGPLQVGHFIGALGIILMAFIEYPGFPLTNLPTPLRDSLQGGLLTVYSINTVLAVVAAFKAPERGQPVPLWVAKTFSVGGLAYDQLMQLPTLEQIEKAKSVKGKRALKNRKR